MEQFKTSIIGIIVLGVISSSIATVIWQNRSNTSGGGAEPEQTTTKDVQTPPAVVGGTARSNPERIENSGDLKKPLAPVPNASIETWRKFGDTTTPSSASATEFPHQESRPINPPTTSTETPPNPLNPIVHAGGTPAVDPRPDVKALLAQAVAAFDAKDYVKAMQLSSQAAAAGDTTAMNQVAFHFRNGLGVAPNYDEALQW
ncbi:MAG: hypothetical protein ACREIC_22485, partial [Limisphaerales bacterium]